MKSYKITVERTELIEFTVQAKDKEAALVKFSHKDETASKTTSLRVVDVEEGTVMRSLVSSDAGDCPVCYSWDDDLAYRDGICEDCYQDNNDA